MDSKLKGTIEKSGNNLHLEVADFLKSEGWEVDLSSYYYDDTTNKPREIDIVATKKIDILDRMFGKPIGEPFWVFLFVECKYFKDGVAFRMQRVKDKRKAVVLGVYNREQLLYNPSVSFGSKHHYVSFLSVGKLYDSPDQNALFDAVTQPVKSLIFFKERKEHRGLYYPITVFDGIDGIYALEKDADLDSLQPEKHVPFEVNYSYRSGTDFKTQQFFVEFVHKGELEKYLKNSIRYDISALESYLNFVGEQKKSG